MTAAYKTIKETDPRTKLFLTACLSSSAVIMTDLIYLLILFSVSLLLLIFFGIDPLKVIKRAKILVTMVFFIAIMQSLFRHSGQALVKLGTITVLSSDGISSAAEFVLRMLIIITSASILTTASSREIIQGLVQWKLPYELAFMAAMGIRFLPVFADEFGNALTAVQLRGVDLKKLPLRRKIEVYACLLQPVAAGALIRSRALSMSIEMRGFRKYQGRTAYLVLKLNAKDYIIMTCAGILTTAALCCYYIL